MKRTRPKIRARLGRSRRKVVRTVNGALRQNRSRGVYRIISVEPPIIYLANWGHPDSVKKAMSPLFDQLRQLPLTLFVKQTWDAESDDRVQLIKRVYLVEHLKRYPNHRVVHLCNSPLQYERFQAAGMRAVFTNQNALVDDALYRPLDGVEPRFDAVYDAKLHPFKRHHLAAKVPNLALTYARFQRGTMYSRQVHEDFSDAYWFNHSDGNGYQNMNPEAINAAYSLCKTGLCLSAVEGAMYASIQYLLAGLPVVSTASRGGRDVFFDERTTLVVADDEDAVRDGVAEMVNRDLDRSEVREITLDKVREHRSRFVTAMQEVYDEEGVKRSVLDDWPDFYVNKLQRNTRHDDALKLLQTS
jgi:glycosyltransferase involved in cell wall biosynthesis